jgi:hypothetical protein
MSQGPHIPATTVLLIDESKNQRKPVGARSTEWGDLDKSIQRALWTRHLTLQTNLEKERVARLRLEGKAAKFGLEIARANQAAEGARERGLTAAKNVAKLQTEAADAKCRQAECERKLARVTKRQEPRSNSNRGGPHIGDGRRRRYLTAEVWGDYAGLLRQVTGQNKSGGGQGIQPSLVPLLRFEIQGVALPA